MATRRPAALAAIVVIFGFGCGSDGNEVPDSRPAVCGDGVVSAPEQCDDGNAVADDGCTACSFDCSASPDCDDGEPCNGDETCGLAHVCEVGTAPGEGAACTTEAIPAGACHGSVCVSVDCGNSTVDPGEDCDDGMNGNDLDGCKDDCRYTCTAVGGCDDGSVCTGTEVCAVDHTCVAGTPLDCVDTSACTSDLCDAVTGCSHPLIDGDGDGFPPSSIPSCGTDCNDASAVIHPGATEVAGDGIDENCDGVELCYVDADGDGYRLGTTVSSADADCNDPGEAPATAPSGDCDDTNPAVHPGAAEVTGDGIDENCDAIEVCFVDADNDGYRMTSTVSSADADCNDPGEAVAADPTGDCDDTNPAVHPGAAEVTGDGVDENCDGGEVCFRDTDNDGYRRATTITSADADCNDPGEAVASDPTGDCDDANPAINPGAAEITGDGVDENCDGGEVCFVDGDNDGYRTNASTASADADCNDPGEAVTSDPTGDCNDAVALINPGAAEITGDGIDENCDGGELCFVDGDNDGYRTNATVGSADADCNDSGEATLSDPGIDCNDAIPAINPGAAEVTGDGIDENCDGGELCFADGDNDGYRLTTTVASADTDCVDSGEATSADPAGDCNDADPTVNPGAAEVTGDGIDENCDGGEVCFVDSDDDGYRLTTTVASADPDCADSGEATSADPTGDCDDANPAINPGAAEVTGDGIDENCDGGEDCFADGDDDGYCTSATVASADADCTDPGEGTASDPGGDCNDTNPAVNPGATEVCFNGVDDNCSVSQDEAPECSIDCNWSGARWLSHGWDSPNFNQTGAFLTCTSGKLAYAQWVNNVGTGVNPAPAGTGDPIVGCDWNATQWLSQGFDGSNAYIDGATVTCTNLTRVTAINWEQNFLPLGPTMSGQLGCNWNGAVFLSHGRDNPCQFQTGINVTCNNLHITNMQFVSTPTCPTVRN